MSAKNGKLLEKKEETVRLRAFARAQIQGQVLVHNEEHLFIAPLSNISAGGLFIDKLVALEEGSEVRVVVKSPKLQNPVQARGLVVRVQKEGNVGLAIEFTSIANHTRDFIQAVVFENKMESALKVA